METIKQTLATVQDTLLGSKTDQNDQVSDSSQQPLQDSSTDQPTQSIPAADQGSRTADGGAHDGLNRSDSSGNSSAVGLNDELEKTLSGPKDPALQGDEHPKMTGEGAPGSHSALFGLTPDGKKA